MQFRAHWCRRQILTSVVVATGLGLVGLAPWVADAQGAPAVVRFGLTNSVGSPFPPPTFDHDQSSNARDNMVPRTVVIPRNGSVFFDVEGRHQPMVYRPGTEPSDIVVPPGPGAIPINDFNPTRFVNGAPALGPGAAGLNKDWPTPPGTFSEAGRYLVICNIKPHFADFNMYGWVIVQ